MEKEYNLLTQRLLAEGHTAESHPDYVEVCRSAWGQELWQNLAGGFEYTRGHLRGLVFRTGCGLLVKGDRFLMGSMSYMGIDWIPENNNPVISCPYRREGCGLRDPALRGITAFRPCNCTLTDEPYCYELSLDKALDDESRLQRQKYDAYVQKMGGHVCHWHTRYDERTGEWEQHYDPMVCARSCQNVGGICSLTHGPVSRKRGNVFYDVKTTHVRRDGTLFDGDEIVTVEKGLRLFETGRSITICEQVAKRCREDIESRIRGRYHSRIRLLGWDVEVLNIRAEQRESRDLLQDLEDIRNGIEVVHASDQKKAEETDQKKRRQQAKEKRISAVEKRILETGYDGLEPEWRRRADRMLESKRIRELERQRRKNLKREQEQPVQLSIFDMM